MTETLKALEVRDLTVSYKGKGPILNNISFQVNKGKSALIIGRSGSGKTTLARAITGLLQKMYDVDVQGDIILMGKRIEEYGINEVSKRMKLIGQNPYVYFVEHIVKSDLLGYVSRFVDVDEAVELIRRHSVMLGAQNLLDRHFYTLSGGEARRLAILKAILIQPDVLILDEPLMWVDDSYTPQLVGLVKKLNSLGISVVILEHRFIPFTEVVDEAYLLSGGELKLIRKDLLSYVVNVHKEQEPVNDGLPKRLGRNNTLASLSDVSFQYDGLPIFEGLNLEIEKGDTVLIKGRNGSGKSTLLKIFAGVLRPKRGKVIFSSKLKIGYLPQRPISFFTEITIEEEIEKVCKQSPEPKACDTRIRAFLRENGVDDISRSPYSLSWGEQVRLALALLMLSGVYQLILLDEPFTGLDYRERCDIGRVISRVTSNHVSSLAVIMTVSSTDYMMCLDASKVYRIENKTLVYDTDGRGSLIYNKRLYETLERFYRGELYV